ncbi:MAG TPA: EI24 domain-containing protein [Allosphingosinicella sp.]|jgi:uncharacterized protein involved in cysteine biosynthesis
MVSAFSLVLGDLRDIRIIRLLLKSLLVTLLIFAALAAAAAWALTGLNPCGIGPLDGRCELGAGKGALGAILLGLLATWFLFPAVAMGVIGFFADEVVDVVEDRHYRHNKGKALPLRRSLAVALRSAGRILLWNLLALPFYLLLLVTGIGPFLLFFAVNAVALGRDLGEMVAVRQLEGEALQRWLATTRLSRALLGLLATWLFMIPLANLLAPVLGAALATHLFHAGRGHER